MPDIISSSSYGSVRLALGLASDDTTNLPDATIADPYFVTAVERRVKRGVTAWSTILTDGGARADALRAGVVGLLSARLAVMYFARKDSGEIRSQALGPASVTFRDGVDWADLANRLVSEAALELAYARTGGASAGLPYVKRSGKTRAGRLAETGADVTYWRDIIKPPRMRREVP